jgi:hypothetical protein
LNDLVQSLIFELTKGESPLGISSWNDKEDDQRPWTNTEPSGPSSAIFGPIPAQVNVVFSNMIYIEKNGLPPAFIHKLQNLAAFQKPDFYKTQAWI